jgi:hypothetical protein
MNALLIGGTVFVIFIFLDIKINSGSPVSLMAFPIHTIPGYAMIRGA